MFSGITETNIAKMSLSELICILVFIAVSFENPATKVDFFLKRRLNRQILFAYHSVVFSGNDRIYRRSL